MKTVGLACTGGGTKAASSIGVIKALEEAGIKINAISGTSIGSCVAILYALGYTPEEIKEKLKRYTVEFPKFSFIEKILAPFRFVIRGGGKNPKIIEESMKEIMKETGKVYMKDIDMPIFIPTLDITNKETVYYTSKELKYEKCFLDRSIAEAVKNTCSVPMLFTPNNVYIDGKLHQFLDGGMTNNTPTTHMDEFVDIVIGVENKYNKKINHKKVNMITGVRNTFQGMRRSAVIFQRKDADIWLQVDCKKVDIIGTPDEIDFCYNQGYEVAKKMIAENKMLFELIN